MPNALINVYWFTSSSIRPCPIKILMTLPMRLKRFGNTHQAFAITGKSVNISMTSIVLIGNDHGGAVLLSCMLDEMLKHYDLRALASGPAYDLWKRSAITIEDIGVNDLKARLKYLQPDLIVTGTSHYSELER